MGFSTIEMKREVNTPLASHGGLNMSIPMAGHLWITGPVFYFFFHVPFLVLCLARL